MLRNATIVAFAAITNGNRARGFYGDILGLPVRYEDDFALSIDVNGIELRLQKVERFTPQPFTTLGWQVADIADVVRRLATQGVSLERYPWMEQDPSGIWLAPSGTRVAWFKDPDGNLLSVSQSPVT